jgi:hypothetical protein
MTLDLDLLAIAGVGVLAAWYGYLILGVTRDWLAERAFARELAAARARRERN